VRPGPWDLTAIGDDGDARFARGVGALELLPHHFRVAPQIGQVGAGVDGGVGEADVQPPAGGTEDTVEVRHELANGRRVCGVEPDEARLHSIDERGQQLGSLARRPFVLVGERDRGRLAAQGEVVGGSHTLPAGADDPVVVTHVPGSFLLPRYASTTSGWLRTSSGDPSAIVRPLARTVRRSQTDVMSRMSWSMISTPHPKRESLAMCRIRFSRSADSTSLSPAAGSSRSRYRGRVARARAISSRRCRP